MSLNVYARTYSHPRRVLKSSSVVKRYVYDTQTKRVVQVPLTQTLKERQAERASRIRK
jgi:hypothetical protein